MKGILFKPDMIKAIVDLRKTVTRRVIKLNTNYEWELVDIGEPIKLFKDGIGGCLFLKPRYQVGEVVYIKEAWEVTGFSLEADLPKRLRVLYKPEDKQIVSVEFNTWHKYAHMGFGKWRSPLFMPAWAARYFIKITDVRAERLQEIGGEGGFGNLPELRAEGLLYGKGWVQGAPDLPMRYDSINAYADLWDSINKDYLWEANPWCWRYEFKQANPNEGVVE